MRACARARARPGRESAGRPQQRFSRPPSPCRRACTPPWCTASPRALLRAQGARAGAHTWLSANACTPYARRSAQRERKRGHHAASGRRIARRLPLGPSYTPPDTLIARQQTAFVAARSGRGRAGTKPARDARCTAPSLPAARGAAATRSQRGSNEDTGNGTGLASGGMAPETGGRPRWNSHWRR